MGKRSSFQRAERDFYPTPFSAVAPLLKHLPDFFWYAEPCIGDGSLVNHLPHHLYYGCDIKTDLKKENLPVFHKKWPIWKIEEKNALDIGHSDVFSAEYIITNPPWSRDILHPMISHFSSLKPTWLLIDADWMHTKQSSEYMKKCHMVVSVGRVKWIPDSKMTGKDNVCWYLFKDTPSETIFKGR